MPFLIQSKGFWPRVEKRLLIALFFLPFGTQNSRIRSVYKVSLSFCFNDEGKQPVKKKAECFKAWRRFYFHHYTFQIRVTDQAWGQYDRIFGQIPFLHFVYRDEVEANEKLEWRQYPVILTEQAWSIGFILWQNYRGFDSQRFVLLLFSVLRVGRPPRHWFISFFQLPFPASFSSKLSVTMVHCAILSPAVAFSVLQTHLRRLATRQVT